MRQKTDILRALQIQSRVIGALLLREVITRYGRHNIGFMWLFAEPMLFTLGITVLWTVAGMHHHSTIPVVAFAVTGYSSVLLWRNMPARTVNAIEPNLSLMYHRQVKVIDIFLSRIILEALGATTSFIFLTLLFVSIGWMRPPEDLLKVILGWFLLGWFGSSLAIILGSLSIRSELVEKFWHPIAYILFPLSGAAFMLEWMPKTIREYLLYFPMVNAIELLRDGFFGDSIRTHYDIVYVCFFCLVLTMFGLAQERIASKEVMPE